MEGTGRIIALDIPAKQLRAANLFRVGALLFKKTLANDNFDDDPPPSASAPVRAFPVMKKEHHNPRRILPSVHPWVACGCPLISEGCPSDTR
jgi:hypothetical protein